MKDKITARMISFAFAFACIAVTMLLIGDADGGLFCGRGAARRAARRESRQSCAAMSYANSMTVTHHYQSVATSQCQSAGCQSLAIAAPTITYDSVGPCASGAACQCAQVQPQAIEYSQSAYNEPGATYEPSVSYPPVTYSDIDRTWRQPGAGSVGQCRLVNGRWQCGG